jgi:4-amino-4-deoxy-L-arabinose transferase-like glycosyltransferase
MPQVQQTRLGIALPALAIALIIALRLWFDAATPPMGDEAYYWIWGQRLGWSYFDHPPLDAWLQAGIAALFGWSAVSLRLLTWFSFAGTFIVLWLMGGELRPAQGGTAWPLRAMLVLLSVPVVALFTMPAFHDHLLVFFTVASIYCFWRFATRWEESGRGIGNLYAAAVLLGFATLSKYNGALLGVGYLVAFLARPKLRTALRRYHPYLAALLAVAMQAPVIYWNLTDGLATLSFHFLERPSGHWTRPDLRQGLFFLLYGIAAAGPFLLLGAPRLLRSRSDTREGTLAAIAGSVFVASTLIMFALSLFTDVLLHWNIVAYVALGIIGVWALGRWLIWPHVLVTLYLLAAAVMGYTHPPGLLPGFKDPGAEANFGWPEVASAVIAAEQQHPGAFLAATKYNYAAQLSFALHRLDVTAINPLRSQYDLWWTAADHIGQDAIIVADRTNSISLSSGHFHSVSKLADVPVMLDGRQIWNFEIYLGTGYQVTDAGSGA